MYRFIYLSLALAVSVHAVDANASERRSSSYVGALLTSGFPAVGNLRYISGRNEYACTISLISSTQVITAGHCFEAVANSRKDFNFTGAYLYIGGLERKSTRVQIHPQFVRGSYDVAVVNMNSPIYASQVAQLPRSVNGIPPPGTNVTLVGYGDNARGLRGKKAATVKALLSSSSPARLFYGNGRTSTEGDSGGPIFNPANQIIGVNAGNHEVGPVISSGYGVSLYAIASWLQSVSPYQQQPWSAIVVPRPFFTPQRIVPWL